MRLKCGKVETSFEYSSPKEFCQSQWQKKEKSLVYLIYRWIVATFFIFSVIVSIVNAALHEHLHVYFIYLTHWNLVFTMITAVWSACLVTRYHYNQLDLQEQMTKELKWFWFLSTSSNMYAFLVSMIYWGILYKSDLNKIDLNNIVVHATNSLVVLFNLAIVKQPERFGLFIYPLCCGCAFLFFSWIYPFLGGKNRRGQDFIYPILNWKQKPETAIIAAVAVTVTGALVHFLLVGLYRIRSRIHEKYFDTKEEKSEDIFTLTC